MKPYISKDYLMGQLKNKTYFEVAKENDVSYRTIFYHAKKLGLTNKAPPKWTKEELDFLKNNYSLNREFFKRFKYRSLLSTYHKASRLGIIRYVKPLKYTIDESFFKYWSKEFAYFLGFFMADGHIALKHQSAVIKLQKRDEYILSKFRELLKTNYSLKYEAGYPVLKMYSRFALNRLVELGCKPSDSINNSYPIGTPNNYFFHFLRGYIDGDGSITLSKCVKSRQKNVLRVYILGSKNFLELIIRKINNLLNTHMNYKIGQTKSPTLYRVALNGELARRLCYKLYEDCGDLCLIRKREKFNTHIKQGFRYVKTSNFG